MKLSEELKKFKESIKPEKLDIIDPLNSKFNLLILQATINEKRIKELEEQLKNKQSTDSSIVKLMNNKYRGAQW